MLEVKSVLIETIIPKNDKHRDIRVNFFVDKTGVGYQYIDFGEELANSLTKAESEGVLSFEDNLIGEPFFENLGFDIPSTLG